MLNWKDGVILTMAMAFSYRIATSHDIYAGHCSASFVTRKAQVQSACHHFFGLLNEPASIVCLHLLVQD